MEKLYMLEVLVNKIVFDKLPVPLKSDIVIQAICPNIGTLEIHTDVMGALENLESKERSSKKKDVDIDSGRSILFPIDAKKLKETLKKDGLQITVSDKRGGQGEIATFLLPWSSDFISMVENTAESVGYVTPVGLEDNFDMTKNGNFAARISMFLRLSFLGRSVYTNIQKMTSTAVADGSPGKQPTTYLFKSVDNATIFECKRHGDGSDNDIMTIGAIYNTATRAELTAKPYGTLGPSQTTKSTETILTLRGKAGSTTSMTPSVFFGINDNDRAAMFQNVLAGSSLSTMAVPMKGERAVMNLTELHMDVSTFSMLANAMGMHVYQDSFDLSDRGEGEEGADGFRPLYVDYKALTVSEIEKRLCKHPDCPAAKLFKAYGIGPLAKNISGLGGMYNDVDAPCAYGLSHCNGTIEDYGPLGRFKKPKKAEEPFVPQSNCKCARKSASVSKSSTGSHTSSKTKTKGKTECYSHCPINPMKIKSKPLRLRGGGEDGPNCETIPNPITLCQDLMDEFNKVLNDYKNALGPCGQATCPFAINMIGDACQGVCNSTDPEYTSKICKMTNEDANLEDKNELTGCGVQNCPYKRTAISPAEREFSKYQGMPGCGYTKCPFVKAKLGMEPDEDSHLPPFKDYEKQETYKFHDALPPIHWDCPDPLPQGDCKNPDCPYVKRDALLKKYFPEPCCPCGSSACPYVCAPCTFPGCPFSIAEPCPPVCPYTGEVPKELKCSASICPFVRKTETRCQNPQCPYKIYEDKLAECQDWKRQQALLAEVVEKEEQICEPCGRGKNKRSENRQNSISMSTSAIKSTTKTSARNISTEMKPVSDPCILSRAAENENASCKPGTCGIAGKICGVCKDKSSKSDIKEEYKSTDIKSKEKQEPQNKEKSMIQSNLKLANKSKEEFVSKSILKQTNDSKLKKNKTIKINTKVSKIKPMTKAATTKAYQSGPSRMGDSSTPMSLSKLCRKFNFRFDKKSFKPCNKIGHRDCVLPKFLVPKCMGWLWNIHEDISGLRPRRGWKPGAVSRMIAFRMDYFKAMRDKRPFGLHQSHHDVLGVKPSQPTIQVIKKGGVVNVTMHPVKDPAEVKKAGDGNPYMDCSPIQFKITKNDLGKEPKYCYCGDQLSDTDSSEVDIEFSPPAALRNPTLIRKYEVAEMEAQYNIDDVPIPVKEPKGGKNKGKGKGKGKKGKKKKK